MPTWLPPILTTLLVALFGWLNQRSLREQDRAQATRDRSQEQRDKAEKDRHEAVQKAIERQQASLEDEIRKTRSDVRLVVGEVGDQGKKIAGLAAWQEASTGRIKAVEDGVLKIVRDGCAHRDACAGRR